MKKKLVALSLAGALFIVPLSTSFAATEDQVDNTISIFVTESAGGGTWKHGFVGIKQTRFIGVLL